MIIKLLEKYCVKSQRRPISSCATEHTCAHSASLFDCGCFLVLISSGTCWAPGVGGSSSHPQAPGGQQGQPLGLQCPRRSWCWPIPLDSDARDACLGQMSCVRPTAGQTHVSALLADQFDRGTKWVASTVLCAQVFFWTALETWASHDEERDVSSFRKNLPLTLGSRWAWHPQ